ncbi:MAG: SEC-C domain-containing protein [Oscillospiraceae bacterium]|nr:SEC-C domain-containing protein [Oscillospiraceae bacterium]
MESLGIDEDTPIDAKILSGAIENAQKTVESRNYQARKNVLEYDDVMNTQRKVIYEQRMQVLNGEDLQKNIEAMMRYIVDSEVENSFGQSNYVEDAAQMRELIGQFEGRYFAPGAWLPTREEIDKLEKKDVKDHLYRLMREAYAAKEAEYGSPTMRELERVITLRVVDEYWMDNIDAMTDLRQGISLRSYGQADPVVEYKREGYAMFEGMINAIKEETVRRLFSVRIRSDKDMERKKVATVTGTGGGDKTVKRQPVVKKVKIGPNDPCPCGSGKKYKKCCRDKDLGRVASDN